jgi:Tfp pilus assembly protein PilP
MKKLIYLATFLILVACSNENDEIVNSKTYNSSSAKSSYKTIIDLNSTKSQSLATYSLNPNEINDIWHLKLENFEKNNTLKTKQKDFINKLKVEINSELFVKNSSHRNDFLSNKKDILMIEAKALFGENEGWYLLTKIENINQRFEKNKVNKKNESASFARWEDDPVRACDCDNTPDCKRITGFGPFSLSWEYGTCTTSNCYVPTYLGLWESDNDGKCKY